MPELGGLSAVAGALRDDADAVIAAWLDSYEASGLRLPGPVDRGALANMAAPAARALAEAIGDGSGDLRPGAPGLREVERVLSFLGGSLAGHEASAFDAAALVLALRDVLGSLTVDEGERKRTAELFDWLVALTLEAFARANREGVREQHRELLEMHSPVVLVAPELPAAFPLGDAEVNGMRGVFARLAMQIARVGARAVIVDASGLSDPAAAGIVDALYEYCTHRKIAGQVALVVCGLGANAGRAWLSVAHRAGVAITLVADFSAAMEFAAEC